MKKEHPEGFYKIDRQTLFRWKLPFEGDQRDCGIIEHDLDYYFFEMLYKHVTRKLYFYLEKISTADAMENGLYEFYIEYFNRRITVQKKLNLSTSELCMPIEKRSNTISLSKNAIKGFLSTYRHFNWSLSIIPDND